MADQGLQSARQLGRRIAAMEGEIERLKRGVRHAQLTHSSIDDGHLEVRDETRQTRARLGRHTDGTVALTYANGPRPPVPTAPTVIAAELSLVVVWDGLMADGSTPPADVVRVDIHESETAGFTPDGSTIRSSLPAEGARLLVLDNQPHHVKLVAVTTSDVASDPSPEVTKTPLPVSDLAAEALVGRTIVGGEIIGAQLMTSEDPPRVIVNPNSDIPEIRWEHPAEEITSSLIDNGSFETDLSGWSGKRGTISRVSSPAAQDGSWSARYDADTTVTGARYIVTDPIIVGDDQAYAVSGWVRGGSGYTHGQANITWRDSGGAILSQEHGDPVELSPDEWREVYVTSVSHIDVSDALVWIQFTPDLEATAAHAYIDNVRFGAVGGYQFVRSEQPDLLHIGSSRHTEGWASRLLMRQFTTQFGVTNTVGFSTGLFMHPDTGITVTTRTADFPVLLVDFRPTGAPAFGSYTLGGTDGIDQGYRTLMLRFTGVKVDDTNSERGLEIQFNGDTGANYSRHRARVFPDGTHAIAANDNDNQIECGSIGNIDSVVEIVIHNYSRTDQWKTVEAHGYVPSKTTTPTTTAHYFYGGGMWKSNSAITEIFLDLFAGNLKSPESYVQMWGM